MRKYLLIVIIIVIITLQSSCSSINTILTTTSLASTTQALSQSSETQSTTTSLASTTQTLSQSSETPQEIWPEEISNEEIVFGFRNKSSDLRVFENNGTLFYIGKLDIDSSSEENATLGLWKMDMDGSNYILLEDRNGFEQQAKNIDSNYSVTPVQILYISDERIYFYCADLLTLTELKVFSTDIQGQDMRYEKALTPEDTAETDNPFQTSISDGINTYSIEEMNKVFCTDADGNKSSLFGIVGSYLNYQDGWIYFNGYDEISKEISIQCINIETGQKQVIYKTNDTAYFFQSINVCGNWVYYVKDFLLYRISTNGQNNTLLVPNPISRFEVFGETIFYYTCELINPTASEVTIEEDVTLKAITIE